MRMMMIFFNSVLASTVFGQNVLSAQSNMFCGGDRIVKQRIVYKDFPDKGENIVWDISDAEPVGDEYVAEYISIGTDTIIGQEHNTLYYNVLRGDSLLQTGFENHKAVAVYDNPKLLLKFPVHYGDMTEGRLHGHIKYYSRGEQYLIGTYRNEADATGTLITPDGDTLRNVLRVHSTDIAGIACTESYRWYVLGYRYPVFETILTQIGKSELTTAFYYPPYEQETALTYDCKNIKTRAQISANRKSCNRSIVRGHFDNAFPVNQSYTIDHSLGDCIIVRYDASKDAPVNIGLYTTGGICLSSFSQSAVSSGSYTSSLDISHIKTGVYILDIKIGELRKAEKITIKK